MGVPRLVCHVEEDRDLDVERERDQLDYVSMDPRHVGSIEEFKWRWQLMPLDAGTADLSGQPGWSGLEST